MSPRNPAAGRAPKVLAVVTEGRVSAAADALLLELSGDDGRAASVSGIQRTLAALTGLDAALRDVERLQQTVAFARTTAHDLAQPLTTILARAQLLMSSMKPEDPHYRAVSIICTEAGRLAEAAGEFSKLKEMASESAARKV